MKNVFWNEEIYPLGIDTVSLKHVLIKIVETVTSRPPPMNSSNPKVNVKKAAKRLAVRKGIRDAL